MAQVCAHLDGIPLAIELAAARVGSLPVEGIAARLDDRFRLLTGGPRTALPRQQTLRAALDWSYDLLTEPEQLLLDRLSVFAGGWTLAAAEAICAGMAAAADRPGPVAAANPLGGPRGEGVEEWEVLDLLAGLVNKSLVQAEEREDGAVRYGLLETVRQYGQERLAAAGLAEVVRDRHLRWYLGLAEQAEPALRGAEQGTWLARLEVEHDNLRSALGWARERGAAEEGLRLAGALWRFWSMRGYFSEGRGWLEGALAGGDAGSPATRAKALNAAGDLAAEQSDFGREVALQEEALALWRQLEDRQGIATSLNRLAWVASLQGDLGRAAALHEESLALQRALGDKRGMARSLNHLGWLAGQQGDFERAVSLCREGLRLGRDVGARDLVAEGLEGLAWVTAARGQADLAARLGGAAEMLREALGVPLLPALRTGHERAVRALRAALGEEAFAAAWTEGRALALEEAVALALAGHADEA